MRTFEKYLIFIMCAIGTIVLVTCDEDEYQQFYDEMLELHNNARAKHGAKPLVWNSKLCDSPRAYLKGLSDGTLKRRGMDWCYHTYITKNTEQVSAETIFNLYYNEGKDYDYTQEPNDNGAGNFTQIVWKYSEEVCFVFMYENNTNYFAAFYEPRGNIEGAYVRNVGRLKKDRQITKYHRRFYEEMLHLHNKARAKHGAQPLVLSDEISVEAMDYLELVINGQADIRQTYWYYNLYMSEVPEKAAAKKVFAYFYNEGKNYDYSQENEYTQNFTRIVWKSTTEVGFALVYENHKTYFLSIYKPMGNMRGMYLENVGQPLTRSCMPFIG